MSHRTSLEMSGRAASRTESTPAELDASLAVLADKAREFARLDASRRAALLRGCVARIEGVAERWVRAACQEKGLSFHGPASSEEWLGGPMTTVRNARLLVRSLDDIAQGGKPVVPGAGFTVAEDGCTRVDVFPTSSLDAITFSGFRGEARLLPGIEPREARERQASAYARKDGEGGVSLVLGAGNVASIPPMDALYKLFVEGRVVLVKMNPVNEYLGPIYEEALAPLVKAGYLRIAYGGGAVGGHLCQHPLVTDIHITGSDRTHDLIVWGPPGPERDRRKADKRPLLQKSITSELGCVTPVVMVPGTFTPSELETLAENVATMVANNASFNCNAAKMLVTSRAWAQREDFLARLRRVLGGVPTRKAYYPGARERYDALLAGHEAVRLGRPEADHLAWALVLGLDAKAEDEKLFTTEPFCALLSETALDARDPAEFLEAATTFCNDRLWGTLSASVVIHPETERAPTVRSAFARALRELRYGAIAVNHWPGLVYGTVSPPWGAHPSSTLEDIQGGLGWVHNTFMLEGIEKTVLRGPLVVRPKPPWFVTHKNAHRVAARLVGLEADPRFWRVPGVAFHALLG